MVQAFTQAQRGRTAMQTFAINYWAVLVASVVKFFIGFVWFTFLFGKQWAALQGMTPGPGDKAVMTRGMIIDFVGGLVLAYVLVHATHYAGASGWAQGAMVGFFNWLGFMAVTSLSSMTWEKRPYQLWVINNAYSLLYMLVMGVIVTVWR
jgi:hypothetical protein